MPVAKVGEKTSLDRREYLELKSKGATVKIRLASEDYYYEGKHFIEGEDSKWTVTSCPRINNEMECHYCDQYFSIMKEVKAAKEAKDKEAEEDLAKTARKVKPTISFYYPVLDRESKSAAVFKTTLMIRLAFEEQVTNGVNILDFDFLVKRTEKPGSYYLLDRIDSAQTPKLSKDEKSELEKAKQMNVGEIVGGKKGSMNFTPDETPVEDIAKDVFGVTE